MISLPEPVKKFIERFSELPGIGPRQATRLAFLLASFNKEEIRGLGAVVSGLQNLKICEYCFFVHQNKETLCGICADPGRRQKLIAVVEQETDLISLENTGQFNGRYLIVGPILKTGILEDWQKLRIQNLKNFIQKNLGGAAEEIILAFNPSRQGDFSASVLAKELQPFAKKISRLGRGLPIGGEIEFADEETLGQALKNRS